MTYTNIYFLYLVSWPLTTRAQLFASLQWMCSTGTVHEKCTTLANIVASTQHPRPITRGNGAGATSVPGEVLVPRIDLGSLGSSIQKNRQRTFHNLRLRKVDWSRWELDTTEHRFWMTVFVSVAIDLSPELGIPAPRDLMAVSQLCRLVFPCIALSPVLLGHGMPRVWDRRRIRLIQRMWDLGEFRWRPWSALCSPRSSECLTRSLSRWSILWVASDLESARLSPQILEEALWQRRDPAPPR